MIEIKYRPEIDGLRAFAVIPVILYHSGFSWMRGGFLGVDVFFVISGYLITSIILYEYNQNRFSFARFWTRRIRRIFPPLAVMLIITALAGYLILWISDLNDLGLQGLSASLSFANITLWRMTGNYWGGAAENSPLLHTWSLSVEEQFYFIYPFIIWLLMRHARKHVFAVVSLAAGTSFALYFLGSRHFPSATFYLLPTRAWELACGCLVAIHAWKHDGMPRGLNASWISTIGLAAIALSYFIVLGSDSCPGCLSLPVLGTVGVIAFSTRDSIATKILSTPLFIGIGKISYSLYLWHWPVMVLARKLNLNTATPETTLPALTLIAVLAVLSYYLVEKPTRKISNILLPASVLFTATIGLFSLCYLTKTTYDTSAYDKVVWAGQQYNVSPNNQWNKRIKERMKGIIVPERDSREGNAYETGGIIRRHGGPVPEIMVLGDSHAVMWSSLVDEISRELGITVSFYGADGAPLFMEIPLKPAKPNAQFSARQMDALNATRLTCLREWKPKVVVLAVRWDELKDARIADDLIQFIGRIGCRVILVEQPPVLYFGDYNALQYLAYLRLWPVPNQRQYLPTVSDRGPYENGKRIIRELAYRHPFCQIIEVEDLFSHGPRSDAWILDGASVLFLDDDHLSQAGTFKMKDRFKAAIQSVFH